jgi:hypothetical protein
MIETTLLLFFLSIWFAADENVVRRLVVADLTLSTIFFRSDLVCGGIGADSLA